MLTKLIRQLVLQKQINGSCYGDISNDILMSRASVQSICCRCNLTKKKTGRKTKIWAREDRYKTCLQK